MLTLILLVVLGGGAGLLAVSLSDRRAPWAPREGPDVPSLRPYPTQDTSPVGAGEPATADAIDVAPTVSEHASDVPWHSERRAYRRVVAPPARTAVEGPYADIAEAPWWRRFVSLALIVTIVGVLGIGIAVVLGGTMAALAELLDGAIG